MHKQGEILLIPIPFSDLSSSKRRPVIVLSNEDYNSKTDDIIVAAITSNILSKEYSVLISSDDLVEGNLKVDSCIRADKIYTLSKNIVIKKFGKVNSDIMSKLEDKVKKLIKLNGNK